MPLIVEQHVSQGIWCSLHTTSSQLPYLALHTPLHYCNAPLHCCLATPWSHAMCCCINQLPHGPASQLHQPPHGLVYFSSPPSPASTPAALPAVLPATRRAGIKKSRDAFMKETWANASTAAVPNHPLSLAPHRAPLEMHTHREAFVFCLFKQCAT